MESTGENTVVETETQEVTPAETKPAKVKKEKVVKEPRPVMTDEEKKAARKVSAAKVLVNRKNAGVAAKQFFIHKSLFAEAEAIMAPILAKSKEIIG
jgi:hypothetical protein